MIKAHYISQKLHVLTKPWCHMNKLLDMYNTYDNFVEHGLSVSNKITYLNI
jgi:hypothetical protein